MEERFLIMSKHNEVKISGVVHRIPSILRRIADVMEVEENNPTPSIEPPKPKYQIHWTYGATGEWLGTLVEETKNHLGVISKQEFSQVILRITTSGFTNGWFTSRSILEHGDRSISPIAITETLKECLELTETWAKAHELRLASVAKENLGLKEVWWR
jgi:hypothetical protein